MRLGGNYGWKMLFCVLVCGSIGVYFAAEWGDDHPKKMNDIVVKPPKYPKVAHNACTGK